MRGGVTGHMWEGGECVCLLIRQQQDMCKSAFTPCPGSLCALCADNSKLRDKLQLCCVSEGAVGTRAVGIKLFV